MLIFVLTELMFFAGLISAFVIAKSSAPFGWPPPDQPRLPIEITGVNTAMLMISGVMLVLAHRRLGKDDKSAKLMLFATIAFGASFVLVQGGEWAGLLGQGLTITSGQLGGFFYLIVGLHALHAVAALLALTWAFGRLLKGTLEAPQLWAVEVFWFFVIGIWPLLYYEVYL